ncbi:MAG: DUF362 domain-containing protein [Deltaproteobacteria bacterium]|nr:DUF362 domain-containing protein [Deltaproteobacteria bacterium]
MNSRVIDRRTFLAAGVGTLLLPVASPIEAQSRDRTRVALVTCPGLIEGNGQVSSSAAAQALDHLVMAVTTKHDPAQAWTTLFSSRDVVGIKVNALAGRGLATHPETAPALAERLVKFCRIPPGQIIIWDRTDRELLRSGFVLQKEDHQVRCFGTDALANGGYEAQPQISGQVGSCFSTIVSRYVTALISLSVLKDHDLSGVSLGMKNFFGAIHNPNKYHDHQCDPYIADLVNHPYIKEKFRLSIIDGLYAQYHGGPSLNVSFRVTRRQLIGGLDPVAVDTVGHQIIEQLRQQHKLKSLKDEGRPPTWLATAAKLGLGRDDMKLIDVIKIDV